MKIRKSGIHELYALAFIVIATGLRLFLISQNWPLTNSDEATIGVMARHIAYQGDLPIFFYGQYYMGSLEAFVAAPFFYLLGGSSLFALRLGLVLLFTVFLISIYFLARMLYSRAWALISVVLLSIGSSYMLEREMSAIGGYPETLLFGSLAFLFAVWLVLSYQTADPRRGRRWLAYGCWGLVVGLGLWSDLLIIPFVAMSGLLLLIFCWRELLNVRSVLMMVAGLLIGAAPLLIYNFRAAPGQDSLTTLWLLQHGGDQPHLGRVALLLLELHNTFFVSIPMMTGNPFCPVTELAFLGLTSPDNLTCGLIHSSWSIAYLLLFAVALLIAGWALWRHMGRMRDGLETEEGRRLRVIQGARLALLGSAILALAFYTFSIAPIYWPGIHARYLVGLLIATPAIYWPLWHGLSASIPRLGMLSQLRKTACAILLTCMGAVLLTGTILMLEEIPAMQATNQQQQALIDHLLSIGATHIYTDYWTCNRIAFVSQEKIICGVVDGNLQPSHNRTPGYYETVSADPHAAYVFAGSMPALVQKVTQSGIHYKRYDFAGYTVYQPY